MSDIKEDFLKNLSGESDLDKKKKEIDANRVNNQYERIKEGERKVALASEASFGPLSAERVLELAKESTDYIESAAASMKFISEVFDGIVPFFSKNMILIGAKTGEGKSTCVANIVRSTIAQINPATGKPRRCLVITNEENIVDFYNRVTCLLKGWHYVNHDKFTQEQKQTFEQYIKLLSKDGRLTVVDDSHRTAGGQTAGGITTTVEGIETIFKNLMRDQEYYDVVIIDYYQGVMESSKDATMDEYKVQRKLTHVLEKYRKVYPAPIILMAQTNPPERDRDSPKPFQVRIQGTKLICTKATMIIEMIPNREELTTEWLIHKGRYAESTGASVFTGYKNGLFVKRDENFVAEVRAMREKKAAAEFDKMAGVKLPQAAEEPAMAGAENE